MKQFERPAYDPAHFAPPPARDSRFDVAEQWVDCANFPVGDGRREIEFFHRQMNEEVNGMECAARIITDFPDAAWELRMAVARQCYDEARHVEMFRGIFERRGGTVGQYPVLNFQYRIITNIDDLYGRLAVQNRWFETEGIDAIEPEVSKARERGDDGLSALFAAQLADEICHVRFGNEHVARAASADPASVMRIGRALNYASAAFLEVMGRDAINLAQYGVNEKGRREAGFSAEEVRLATESKSSARARQTSDRG